MLYTGSLLLRRLSSIFYVHLCKEDGSARCHAGDVLPHVESASGKLAQRPTSEERPSLCPANISTWHGVLFSELLLQWDQTAAMLQQSKGSRKLLPPEQVRHPILSANPPEILH